MNMTVSSISYGYTRERQILDHISFTAHAGKILGLLGPNGTGKTTLLKCISHIYSPWEGTVEIDGRSLAAMSAKTRARYIGYVPQNTHSVFPIRVIDAVMMGRLPFVTSRIGAADKEVVFSILKQMKLEHFAFRNLNEMSGGERQRVFIARALAQEPKVLLLDEPTSSMDLKNQLTTLQLIRSLIREKHLAAVISIHDLNLAAMFCDTVMILNGTSVFACGTPGEVITAENIRTVYGVKAAVDYEQQLPHMRLLDE